MHTINNFNNGYPVVNKRAIGNSTRVIDGRVFVVDVNCTISYSDIDLVLRYIDNSLDKSIRLTDTIRVYKFNNNVAISLEWRVEGQVYAMEGYLKSLRNYRDYVLSGEVLRDGTLERVIERYGLSNTSVSSILRKVIDTVIQCSMMDRVVLPIVLKTNPSGSIIIPRVKELYKDKEFWIGGITRYYSRDINYAGHWGGM